MSVVLALSPKGQTDRERDEYANAEVEVGMYWRGWKCLAAPAPAARLVFASRLVGQLG